MTHHLDEFSKSLAEPLPRRESLRRLGIVLAGAVLSPLGSAFASHQDPCKAFCRCRKGKQQNQCLAACRACNTDPSRVAGNCGNYFCCGAGQTSCGNYCADLGSDPWNCGACGYACDQPGLNEYGACIDGACRYACANGAVNCNGACTFLAWDPANCGDCGFVCPAEAPYCAGGTCSFCPPDVVPCGHGCCGYGEICVDGVCQPGSGGECTPDHPYYPNCCPGGSTNCGGFCVYVDSDPFNCGACGNVCPVGHVCFVGTCCNPTVSCCFPGCEPPTP